MEGMIARSLRNVGVGSPVGEKKKKGVVGAPVRKS